MKNVSAELVELDVEFKTGAANRLLIKIRGIEIVYHMEKQEIGLAGHRASAPLVNHKQRLIIHCDRTGIELFASEGLCYMPQPVNVDPTNRQLAVATQGGEAIITSLRLTNCRPHGSRDRGGWKFKTRRELQHEFDGPKCKANACLNVSR
ncbi:MAG: hypothetical protein ACK5YR_18560 [Pirellula sp.]